MSEPTRKDRDYQMLQDAPTGSVAWNQRDNTYWRKGRRNTWHEIDQRDGQRLGMDYTKAFTMAYWHVGPWALDTAETERLKNIKRQPGIRL